MIHRAKPRDLLAILALEEAAFPENERWSEQSWNAELSGHDRCVLVDCDDEQRVRGVITGQVVADVADVHRIIVAETEQRQGVGKALMSAILAWAAEAGATRVMLEVAATNEAAIALYHAFGFQSLSFRADYYGPGSDACVLEVQVAMPSRNDPAHDQSSQGQP
jgi:ribosomal-protein-alanine acetyltransferase